METLVHSFKKIIDENISKVIFVLNNLPCIFKLPFTVFASFHNPCSMSNNYFYNIHYVEIEIKFFGIFMIILSEDLKALSHTGQDPSKRYDIPLPVS